MLGFFYKRIWKEPVKLATQNLLACQYLVEFEENAIEAGLRDASQFPYGWATVSFQKKPA